MYQWVYFLPADYVCMALIPPMFSTSTSLPDENGNSVQNTHTAKQNNQVCQTILNLTVDDLLKAGYQNNKTPWTQEEDEKLKNLRDIQQLDWAELANFMPGRNSKMCYSRYRKLQNNTKQAWKNKENNLLIQLVTNLGQDWKEISKQFPKRTLKQVKQHYLNYLKPDIKKDDWTVEQDMKLVEQINRYGKNWKQIFKKFEGRTQNQIKNRYFGRLKRLAQKKALNKQKCQTQSKNKRMD